jgi:hypothetical protein
VPGEATLQHAGLVVTTIPQAGASLALPARRLNER